MMQARPRAAGPDQWTCPLSEDRLHAVLETSCQWGATRVTLFDLKGGERARLDPKVIARLDRRNRLNGPREVRATVVVRSQAVGILVATVAGDVGHDPDAAIQAAADHLAAAWGAAEEID